MRQYTISRDSAGQRADRFLRKAAPDISASLLQKTFRLRDVKCGGKRIPAAYILSEGEEICAYFPENIPIPSETKSWTVYDLPDSIQPALSVVYEDAHISVVHKPAGLASQGDDQRGEPSVELWFRRNEKLSGRWKPEESHGFVPSLCHRIDRQTEGLLLCAKSAEALRLLTEMIRKRELRKGYKALVWGCPKPQSGTWRDYLYKEPANSYVTVHQDRAKGAKSASLSYRVEATMLAGEGNRRGKASLLDIDLHTGRTHQIRVQCASRGHAVLGDGKYGGTEKGSCERIALCAYRLEFAFQGDAGVLTPLAGRVFEISANFSDFSPESL